MCATMPWTAVTGTDDVDHVEIVLFDQPVEVDIEKVQPRRGAPMSEQPGLDMLRSERGFQQRVVLAGRSARPKGSLPRASKRAFLSGDRATRDRP